MADHVARAIEREAASRRILILGFAYPDATDIRSALPRGSSRAQVHEPGKPRHPRHELTEDARPGSEVAT